MSVQLGQYWHRAVKVACVALLICTTPASAINFSFPGVDIHDVFYFLVYDYGLAPGAAVEIDLKCDPPRDSTYLMMLTRGQWNQWRRQDPPSLFGPAGGMFGLNPVDGFLVSYWRTDISNHTTVSFTMGAPENDRYYLGVFNARLQDLRLSGTVRFVNPGGEELPVEFVHLPVVLITSATLFLLSGAALLLALLVGSWRRGRTAIHFVICAVVLAKALVAFLKWRSRHRVSEAGQDTLLGEVTWQLLDKAQETLEISMFLLVALGWKVVRARLDMAEVRFVAAAALLSLYLGACEVACVTDASCSSYKLGRYTLHTICSLVIVMATNLNLQVLHAQLSDGPASLEVGTMYARLRAFAVFRWAFLAFISAPTFELFLRVTAMPWDALWAYHAIQSARTLAIYLAVAFFFRPAKPLGAIELVSSADRDDDSDTNDDIEEFALPSSAAPRTGGFGRVGALDAMDEQE